MNDMRRALLWGVFSMSLVMLWDGWNKHTGQPSMFDPAPAVQTAPAAVTGASAAAGALPSPVGSAAAASAAALPAAVQAPPSETVQIETDTVRATLDTRGGSLVTLDLLAYADHADDKRPVRLLDRSGSRVYTAETGLISSTPGTALPNHFTPMTLRPGPRSLAAGEKELKLQFEASSGGVTLVKTYTFRRGEYAVDVQHQVTNAGTAPVNVQAYLQLVRDGEVPHSSIFTAPASFTGPAVYTDAKKFQKVEFTAIEKGKAEHEKTADNGWVAMVQHYFTAAWLVNAKAAREFRTTKVDNNLYSVAMVMPLGELAPGASTSHQAVLYAGPQEEKKLEALAPGLELVKDYGILTVLSKPLFWLLDKLHGVIGNWGWAIVALVVLLKIAFYWLNASAYRSMAKMKAINPKVMELRERYKDKPQQMQQEMMRIYREEKVNPLGGCLPILVQMPFFIALYWVLLSSVEMRNAPWIGWIHDLSTPDPFFILPVLMTLSTLFQTWLNPTPPDPVQAKMMWIMPLVFSVFFFFFPAGLVLYWLTNNLLGIAQQWLINRQLGLKH